MSAALFSIECSFGLWGGPGRSRGHLHAHFNSLPMFHPSRLGSNDMAFYTSAPMQRVDEPIKSEFYLLSINSWVDDGEKMDSGFFKYFLKHFMIDALCWMIQKLWIVYKKRFYDCTNLNCRILRELQQPESISDLKSKWRRGKPLNLNTK